jgi:hypothetical protein
LGREAVNGRVNVYDRSRCDNDVIHDVIRRVAGVGEVNDVDSHAMFLSRAEMCWLLVLCVLFAVIGTSMSFILYKFLTCNIPCVGGNPFALAMSCLR